jgi:hypothetical protein
MKDRWGFTTEDRVKQFHRSLEHLDDAFDDADYLAEIALESNPDLPTALHIVALRRALKDAKAFFEKQSSVCPA